MIISSFIFLILEIIWDIFYQNSEALMIHISLYFLLLTLDYYIDYLHDEVQRLQVHYFEYTYISWLTHDLVY